MVATRATRLTGWDCLRQYLLALGEWVSTNWHLWMYHDTSNAEGLREPAGDKKNGACEGRTVCKDIVWMWQQHRMWLCTLFCICVKGHVLVIPSCDLFADFMMRFKISSSTWNIDLRSTTCEREWWKEYRRLYCSCGQLQRSVLVTCAGCIPSKFYQIIHFYWQCAHNQGLMFACDVHSHVEGCYLYASGASWRKVLWAWLSKGRMHFDWVCSAWNLVPAHFTTQSHGVLM